MTLLTRGRLTDRQARMLSFIRDFWRENQGAPSFREIMAGADVSSTSIVAYNLRALERRGWIELAKPNFEFTARSIRLVLRPGDACPCCGREVEA